MSHLHFTPKTEATNEKLLANRYQHSTYENLATSLEKIEGIAGFIQDMTLFAIEGDKCIQLDIKNLFAIADTIVLEAQETSILLNALGETNQEVDNV